MPSEAALVLRSTSRSGSNKPMTKGAPIAPLTHASINMACRRQTVSSESRSTPCCISTYLATESTSLVSKMNDPVAATSMCIASNANSIRMHRLSISHKNPRTARLPKRVKSSTFLRCGRYNTTLSVVNTNRAYQGELELVAEGLPDGVKMEAPRLTPEMTRVPVVYFGR
jgi:hypothetical protein